MNKLLALSIALLSVSLYGADKKSPNQIDVKDALIRELNAQNRQLQIERNELKQKFDVLTKKMEIESELWQRRLAAAGKAEKSLNGLEGFANSPFTTLVKHGIAVAVEDYSDVDKTFDVKAIKNQIELRLIQSGIKIANQSGFLHINVQPIPEGAGVVGYVVSIEAKRGVTFEANGKTYEKIATVWQDGGLTPVDELRPTINKYTDKFLLDYLKANPKKKEK